MDFPQKNLNQKNQTILKSTLLMSFGTFLSRILGLARDMAIGAFFTRTETDAFLVAFRLPNFFRRFLGEGALTISFIPIFIHKLSGKDEKTRAQFQAKNFMNSIYTLLLLTVSILTGMGVLWIEPLLEGLFRDSPFDEVEGKINMTVIMARLLFIYLFLVTLYGYFTAVANALGKFFLPAFAPALLNVGIILFSFLPKDHLSIPPLLLCGGVLTGGLLQMGITAGLLWKMNFLPRPVVRIGLEDIKLLLSRFFPGLIGVGGFAVISLLNLYFAGQLAEGTHTFIYYGDRLLELPRSLIAVSMGTALLPGLSKLVAQGQKQKMLDTAAESRDTLLFLILPCALGFYYLGLPIVETLFKRGYFDSFTAGKTAQVLQIYAVLAVTSSLSRVLASCFYAVKNTWHPALASLIYILFHWLITPYMIESFDLPGLIWASVLSNSLFLFILLCIYPFFIGPLYLLRSLKHALYLLPSLGCLSLYISYGFNFLEKILSTGPALFFVIISSIPLYIGLSAFLRLPQALEYTTLLKKKFSNANRNH